MHLTVSPMDSISSETKQSTTKTYFRYRRITEPPSSSRLNTSLELDLFSKRAQSKLSAIVKRTTYTIRLTFFTRNNFILTQNTVK
ncbi:hypothetical protein JTE90_002024 [Oedothorax gibbosus]|uniref:Uncharacterized protein n=1 Tax=Oedothorax gibbosus TaxID=931172 RepID=A0AAV6UQ96_9ARAC|nr:hypothetical protein JTE90_002024 [Oedothorax gibbosus]